MPALSRGTHVCPLGLPRLCGGVGTPPYAGRTAGVLGVCSHPLGIAGILIAATSTRSATRNDRRSIGIKAGRLDRPVLRDGEITAARGDRISAAQVLRIARNYTSSCASTSGNSSAAFVSSTESWIL